MPSCDGHALGSGAIARLTDDTGMLQHSRFGIPDRVHGYCIDDNARALMLMAVADDLPAPLRLKWAHIYLAFIQHAWNIDTKRFRNFMSFDRQWLEREGSPDSNARTLWALAVAEALLPDEGISRTAAALIDEAIVHPGDDASPRAAAFTILAMVTRSRHRGLCGPAAELLTASAELLMRLFEAHARPDWRWFEPYLSYDNDRLPEAMLYAGQALDRPDMIKVGKDALTWLIQRQIGPDGIYRPVATRDFGVAYSGAEKYDQQPIEAWAALDAAIAAQRICPKDQWLHYGIAAYAWFTGSNDVGHPIASLETGECYDGITPDGFNLNRGAESVLAWQFANRRIRALQKLEQRTASDGFEN